eukprot:9392653-Karenia_brevis.AAC.1
MGQKHRFQRWPLFPTAGRRRGFAKPQVVLNQGNFTIGTPRDAGDKSIDHGLSGGGNEQESHNH